MASVVPLQYLDEFTNHELEAMIARASRPGTLRRAAERLIRSIHGLPDVLEVKLQQIEVYIGRAAATGTHLKNRWWHRLDEFEYSPSTHALVVARTTTKRLRTGRWERAAQFIVDRLKRNGALCCSNALVGENGRWPSTGESIIYLVARTRRGPAGVQVSEVRINRAVSELLQDSTTVALPADVLVAAGRKILDRADREHHEWVAPQSWSRPEPNAVLVCRRQGCKGSAKIGNYGFCGRHRPFVEEGVPACKACGRRARPGNYGFCGLHR